MMLTRPFRRFLSSTAPKRGTPIVPNLTTYVQTPGAAELRTATLIYGDGAGPEMCQSIVDIFKAARVPIRWDLITEHADKNGLPSKQLIDSLKRNKVGLKGLFFTSTGGAQKSLNLQIRQTLRQYVNIVHAVSIPGHKTRHDFLDLTIIRENTEGEYSGLEHEVVPGVVESLKVCSEQGCTNIANYAFEYAYLNGRKKVSAVHKANIQKMADGLFLKCVREVAKKYPFIQYEEVIIDNCCMQLVKNPGQFDVMVMPNLYGGLISNIAAGLIGGVGLCPGANVGTEVATFEQGARHVASDIAGLNIVNPTSLLLSSLMMLRHIMLPQFADRIEKALLRVLEERKCLTRDMGGQATTTEFTKAIINSLE